MAYFSFNFNIITKETYKLQRILNDKIVGFTESEKEKFGYYYLSNLLQKINDLMLRNEDEFYQRINLIVTEFPVKNNNIIQQGNYISYFENFKKYIKLELGLVPKGFHGFKSSQYLLIIGIIISIFTNTYLITIPFCLFIGLIYGNTLDKKAEKQGRVL